MALKSVSFSDFGKLLLKGELKLLTFGEYSTKTIGNSNKNKRRRVIKHFYDSLTNKKVITAL